MWSRGTLGIRLGIRTCPLSVLCLSFGPPLSGKEPLSKCDTSFVWGIITSGPHELAFAPSVPCRRPGPDVAQPRHRAHVPSKKKWLVTVNGCKDNTRQQLFSLSPASLLPAFPSLLPQSSYHHSQTYSTLTVTPLRVQQVVLVPVMSLLVEGGNPAVRDSHMMPVTRKAATRTFKVIDMHMSGESPWATLTSSTTPSATAKISGAILIPETELMSTGAADIHVNSCHNAHGGRLLNDVWARNVRTRPVPLRTAVPTLVTVRDLRHIDWCSADTLP
ncbi:hypothetical protein DFH07DRAFT_769641 [Mycena maculata]|uniref:Uncharacterized protein n=1 Tax=Mycena maculata TaxID=230809 RepID=A0AAD7JNB1_9AGAR|nr:hypothetical protein DFH07DRAFT_769641 [Mycena maculata]